MLRSISRNLFLLTVVSSTLPSLGASQSAAIRQLEAEKEAVELISRLENVGRDVHYNANRLNSFRGSDRISEWTYDHYLRQIRSLVQEGLRPALQRLAEIRPRLPDWQQDSIDLMFSPAQALSADANSAALSGRKAGASSPFLNSDLRRLLAKIYDHAQTLVETSDAAEDYAAAHQLALETGLKTLRP